MTTGCPIHDGFIVMGGGRCLYLPQPHRDSHHAKIVEMISVSNVTMRYGAKLLF